MMNVCDGLPVMHPLIKPKLVVDYDKEMAFKGRCEYATEHEWIEDHLNFVLNNPRLVEDSGKVRESSKLAESSLKFDEYVYCDYFKPLARLESYQHLHKYPSVRIADDDRDNKDLNEKGEWVYTLTTKPYQLPNSERRILKIGLTTNGIKERWGSYQSGVYTNRLQELEASKNKKKGKANCSITNFHVLHTVLHLIHHNNLVEICGYKLPVVPVIIPMYGADRRVLASVSREFESEAIRAYDDQIRDLGITSPLPTNRKDGAKKKMKVVV